ncbi:MAG: transposase [Lentisphaeraceae bacterium]|nr:transposase [Lentisphaeraceae bacterium]
MSPLIEILHSGFDTYCEKFPTVPNAHIQAVKATLSCRSGENGGHVYRCVSHKCSHEEFTPHSCGHRCCPKCRKRKQLEWKLTQKSLLLPVQYYHLVFTIPAGLRELSKCYKALFLDLLFKVSANVIKRFTSDTKWLGGKAAFMSFLHTWGDSLIWHPHIHILMPAIALNNDEVVYPKNAKFLFPVHALSEVFKAEMLKALRRALPQENIPYFHKKYKWVTYCEGVKKNKAQHVIDYLGKYFNRTAISEHRILSYDNQTVSFSYRKERKGSQAKIESIMTLSIHEFLRRFLQHVPWKGMHRVRYYGFLHPSQKSTILRIQNQLCDLKFATKITLIKEQIKVLIRQKEITCPECGGFMKVCRTLSRRRQEVPQRAPPIL